MSHGEGFGVWQNLLTMLSIKSIVQGEVVDGSTKLNELPRGHQLLMSIRKFLFDFDEVAYMYSSSALICGVSSVVCC